MPVLRPLTAADVDELVEIQRVGAVTALAHLFPQETNPFPVDEIRARWAGELADPTVDCFAIVRDGVIAGFAATRGGELLHLGTALDSWGSGLAGAAHDELVEHLRAGGHARAWLLVFEENERAIRFYARRGWRPTDHTQRTTFPPYPVLRRFELDLEASRRRECLLVEPVGQ